MPSHGDQVLLNYQAPDLKLTGLTPNSAVDLNLFITEAPADLREYTLVYWKMHLFISLTRMATQPRTQS